MKYTILAAFKSFLIEFGLRLNTARIYYNRMDQLLKEQYFIHHGGDINFDQVIDHMTHIVYKNHFSQCKNALRYFLEYQQTDLSNEQWERLSQLETNTTKRTTHPKAINDQRIHRTIQRIKNRKLKLCYLTLLETGLRVFELAQITKKDCDITDQSIQFSFIGKGGELETTRIDRVNSVRLYDELRETIDNVSHGDRKLFYSSRYLQAKAKHYGFACHDLRRICAKREYDKTGSKAEVKKKLRHSRIKTTDIYLQNVTHLE